MSYTDYKITTEQINEKHVQGATDYLIGTAQQNKAVFDELPEFIADMHNDLIDALDTQQGTIETKLATIEEGAEVNVQSNWEESDTTADDYIKNKPTNATTSTSGFMSASDKTKLDGIESGAQVNTVTGVKGNSEGSYRTGNVNITKANIGLGNVDNTADTDKPISAATQTALDDKVDKVTGKGLSANDYTTAEKTKLAGIAEGAEVNVQSNWSEADTSSDAYIQNKPNIPDIEVQRVQTTGTHIATISVDGVDTSLYAPTTSGGSATVDSDLSTISENPVQNKVITNAIHDCTLSNTASGTIATFTDGAEYPLKSCTAEINPIQDLNGYANPWAAGGGGNLWGGEAFLQLANNWTNAVVDYDSMTLVGAVPNLSTRANFYSNFEDGTQYTIFWGASITNTGLYVVYKDGTDSIIISGTPYVTDASKNVDYLRFYVATSDNITFYANQIGIFKGSLSASDYKPYSNICSISGWDSVGAVRTGKNLLDPSILKNQVAWNSGVIQLAPNTTYTLSTDCDSNIIYIYMNYNGGGFSGSVQAYNGHSVTFTTGADGLAMYQQRVPGAGNVTDYWYQLEVGSTATTYEAYNGTTKTITLPQTTYGGSLDVTSGVLTVTHGVETFDGSENWWLQNGVFVYDGMTGIKQYSTTSTEAAVIADRFVSNGAKYRDDCGDGNIIKTVGGNNQIACYSSLYADVDAFKASLSSEPMTVCYLLATPITYQLTPTEITALKGTNNVWADSGDVSVEYLVDSKQSDTILEMLDKKADTSDLATVATSGSYADLTNKPSLATVATSGSYNDLTDKPTIVNDVQVNGTSVVTNGVAEVDTEKIPIDITASAGTVDGDLYAAILALGWESEVIV